MKYFDHLKLCFQDSPNFRFAYHRQHWCWRGSPRSTHPQGVESLSEGIATSISRLWASLITVRSARFLDCHPRMTCDSLLSSVDCWSAHVMQLLPIHHRSSPFDRLSGAEAVSEPQGRYQPSRVWPPDLSAPDTGTSGYKFARHGVVVLLQICIAGSRSVL